MRWAKVYLQIPVYIPARLWDKYLIKRHGYIKCQQCNRAIQEKDNFCQWCGNLNSSTTS